MPVLHGNTFSAKSVTETAVNVASNTWIKLPTIAMEGRASVEVLNKGEKILYLSFTNVDSAGNTLAVQFRGAIKTGQFKIFPIQDNLTLYGRSDPNAGGSTRAIITEYK